MSNPEKLLEKARESPNNLRFKELCDLAVSYGFKFKRQSGSHHLYEHPQLTPEEGGCQNFQDSRGKAKPYQVRQLVKAINELINHE